MKDSSDLVIDIRNELTLDQSIIAMQAHDDAIRREFWDELQREAEIHCDRRVKLLGSIETTDDAAFRKALLDGWSAWLLAKKIIDSRRAAILATEPARVHYSCDGCQYQSEPHDYGDTISSCHNPRTCHWFKLYEPAREES